ncbi:hypothetical protein ACIBLA_37445 [Streptomyces sp. NPDC050433]|uniref:hypothetical protein n=1 Tax=Streptomyces sp. NPDC050433 TaxID=3365615 RepID=UPI0037A3AD2D
MRLADHHAVSAAYALADRELTRALISRIREETVELLGSSAPLPKVLLEEVMASRDPELLAALVSSAALRGEVFDRLAALGDPALAVSLYGKQDWERTPAQRAAVWAGAAATADDPGWRAKGSLPLKLLSSRRRELLEPALLSPFPDLVEVARRVTAKGPDITGTSSTGAPNSKPPKDRRQWERHPETTKELVEDFRDKNFHGSIELPGTPGALDWDVLVAEHRAEPFRHSGLVTLWAHPDCPEELALAAFEANWNSSQISGAVHWSMLASPTLNSLEDYPLSQLLGRGLSSGTVPVERLLREIGSARRILCALPRENEEVQAALAAQVARLGSDFAPWRAVYVLLPRFSGTVTELVDAALAETPKHHGKTWPKPLGPEFPSRGLPSGRLAWLRLYDVADHTTRRALIDHMDLRAIQQLLLSHRPSSELRAHIVQSRGTSALAGIASSWQTRPETIEDLIPYNDSEVNAALFLNTDLTPAQRRHVVSGRLWQDGVSADTPAADRLPLTESLIEGLRESARRPWLLACAESGDPLLCRILLGSPRVKIHTPALELHMLIRLWERHGPDAVRELLDETDFPGRKQAKHPLSPKTLEKWRAALEAESEPDGLALLRSAAEAAAGPVGRADFLADKGSGPESDDLAKAIDLLAEEAGPGPIPWAELEAAGGTKPLHDRLLVRLAELEGCPEAFTEESAAAALRLSHPEYRPRRTGKPPTASEMLRKLPLRVDNRGGCGWLEKAHQLGQVTLPDVVRCGFPAKATVAFLATALAPGDSPATDQIREARREVAALAAEHLGANPEGWALALRLIPDFEGTLPDLLLASGAVVS